MGQKEPLVNLYCKARLCENCGYPFWHHTGKDLNPPLNLCPYPRQGKQFKPKAVITVKT